MLRSGASTRPTTKGGSLPAKDVVIKAAPPSKLMISAANNGQRTLSDVTARNIGLAAAEDVPASQTAAQLPALQPPDASASLSQEEWIPTWKRLLDLTLIFLTLPIWLSAMGVVSLWILLVSPGPLLYRQERIGYRAGTL